MNETAWIEDGGYHDLIEWVAQQPWCSGEVGMIGLSCYGIIQLFAAV
ncbi:MAG: hypothetical protein JRC68_08120 [Deltaproteobacteria bacterium]|nr:hypothetical protein [Deltaproteobacteria bacterium]